MLIFWVVIFVVVSGTVESGWDVVMASLLVTVVLAFAIVSPVT